MALTDGQTTTKTAIAEAFATAMVALFPLDPELTTEQADSIRANWSKMGQAIADATLASICVHFVTNAEIGTGVSGPITSDVVGALATQNNAGTGLIQ